MADLSIPVFSFEYDFLADYWQAEVIPALTVETAEYIRDNKNRIISFDDEITSVDELAGFIDVCNDFYLEVDIIDDANLDDLKHEAVIDFCRAFI